MIHLNNGVSARNVIIQALAVILSGGEQSRTEKKRTEVAVLRFLKISENQCKTVTDLLSREFQEGEWLREGSVGANGKIIDR